MSANRLGTATDNFLLQVAHMAYQRAISAVTFSLFLGVLCACDGGVSSSTSSSVSSLSSIDQASSSEALQSSSSVPPMNSSAATSSEGIELGSLVYANNSGGDEVLLDGVTYSADRFFSGGMRSQTMDAITGTNSDSLYQTELYGNITYEVPVSNAAYSVRLHFAEIYHTAANARLFSLTVEGQTVFADWDLFEEAGHDVAIDIDVPLVVVADGSLSIEMTASVDAAKISGFAIYSNDGGELNLPPEPEIGEAIPSPGCGTARGLMDGTHTITSSGESRQFILDVPNNYDNTKPYRLIFGIHAFYGHMDRIADGSEIGQEGVPRYAHYGLKQYDTDGTTIFVAPNGTGSPNGWPNQDGKQTRFFDDMLKLISEELCIDQSRIFAHGFSYGSGMSFNLACERPDIFRAVGVYAPGDPVVSCANPSKPVAYFGVHGTSDGTFNINTAGAKYRDILLRANGCTLKDSPQPAQGSRSHICTTYDCPDERYPARWCAFDEGHIPAPVDGRSGNGSDTWVAKEAWQFFTQF